MIAEAFVKRRVLVTGHTGFKGAWLCEWLLGLGAEVHGMALDPQPDAVLFGQLGLAKRLSSDIRADVADRDTLTRIVAETRAEFVFHLAAQSLVRASYRDPVGTFATNVMGTAHLLEAVRLAETPCTVVCVTTDKCYENREWPHAYREDDAIGGHDPYSASKGAAELLIASYRRSFFPPEGLVRLASARAGNVIGGGDWAAERIVPDCIRAVRAGKPVMVRNRQSTRPWQHVLEPLSGYLLLAAALATCAPPRRHDLCSAFNFGPSVDSNRTVAELVAELLETTGGQWVDANQPNAPHEASQLHLATVKAYHLLGWKPQWSFADAVRHTADWYVAEALGQDVAELTRAQIATYHRNLREGRTHMHLQP
jgi:CDP-glucose 4,6-dehydratase